jgi:hypothetical protein
MLDEFTSMPFATSRWLRANVHEVPSLVLTVTQRGVHSVVKEGEELIEEAAFAFWREAIIETPHTAAEHGQVVVHILAGRHPTDISI